MPQHTIREHIAAVILETLQRSSATRTEALNDFFALSMGIEEAQTLSGLVPPLLPSLYEKWVALFTDRLLETIPADQLSELCNGTPDNNAALILTYLMFLESARMEKQIDTDLKAYALEQTGKEETSDALAAYIRARMKGLATALKT